VVQTDLAEKKEKKKNLWLRKTGHIWRRFSLSIFFCFTGVGCVNQNHNKDTMKGEKITTCVVINSTLEQLRTELLENGRALLAARCAISGYESRFCRYRRNRVSVGGPT